MNSESKILHIAGGVSIQKLYQNIFLEFSKRNTYQDVYVPCNHSSKLDKNVIKLPGLSYRFKVVGNFFDRVLFYPKIDKHFIEIKKAFDIEQYAHCFAYTVMTDGSLAYRLKKKNGTPYSVFVRNTDINIFYKYFIWLRPLFKTILKEAEAINFPNPSYKTRLISMIGVKFAREIENKVHIIPNGIDNFWHEHRRSSPKGEINNPIQLLFVGKIDENKNVSSLVKALKILNDHGCYRLTLIGSVDEDKKQELQKWQAKLQGLLSYQGQIEDKNALLGHYRASDIFVMPSLTETFGLVYIEALSQGVPIIYTQGEGVSGFFEGKLVGLGINNPKNSKEICEKILEVSTKYHIFTQNTIAESAKFSWTEIIDLYIKQISS